MNKPLGNTNADMKQLLYGLYQWYDKTKSAKEMATQVLAKYMEARKTTKIWSLLLNIINIIIQDQGESNLVKNH